MSELPVTRPECGIPKRVGVAGMVGSLNTVNRLSVLLALGHFAAQRFPGTVMSELLISQGFFLVFRCVSITKYDRTIIHTQVIA